MKNMKYPFLMALLSISLVFSCSKDSNGGGTSIEVGSTLTAEMGADLSQQVYVDLSTGKMTPVKVNTWELAFENKGSGLRTNSAKKVSVATPATTDLDAVDNDTGLVYAFDSDDGDLNTTALAGWQTNQPYIIDLGVDENGNALGKKKFMITASDASTVSIQYADLDGSNAGSADISLGGGNFTYFSLINEAVATVEPASWDFVLSAISVRTGAPCFALGPNALPGINCDIYRLAASAISNSYDGVEIAKDDPFENLEQNDDPEAEKNKNTITSSNFDQLLISDFNVLGSSTAANAMGRSWLQILAPHSSGIYKVYDFITYLVKDEDGNYYKVRFLAYKGGSNADNGYPTFEYELMTN